MDRRGFLGAGCAAGLVAACTTTPLLPAHSFAEDLAIIREAIAIHPGALRYLDDASLEAALQRLETAYTAAPDLAGRYLALSAFLAKLKCGHTHCNFYNQSDEVRAELFDRPTRLPFLFRWIDSAMVVTRDLTGTRRLQPGTVIETIDGRSVQRILAALLAYARADGGNTGKRVAQLEVTGGERYPAFDIFQGLVFPPKGGSFALDFTAPDGSAGTMRAPALTAAERISAAPPPAYDGSPLWTFDLRSDGIALLTMPTWVVYRGGWDWAGWLAERAPAMYGARGLVVDVRGNEGGLSCGDAILARLTARDIVLDEYVKRIRYRRFGPLLSAHADTYDPAFPTLGEALVEAGGGFYVQPPGTPPEVISAESPRLTTPTAILTDAHNSSATFLFARNAKRHGLATLVGAPTGGNLRGINAGAVAFVRLPQSGIEFDLPLIGYFEREERPDRGVLPDLAVDETVDDIAAARDRVLEAAVARLGATA